MIRKTTIRIFQVTYKRNVTRENLTWLSQGSLKRETESPIIAAQINAICTQFIKARMHKMQRYRKCWLWDGSEEIINHITSEYSKLAVKVYKTRQNGWIRGSTGSCVRSLNLTIQINDICTIQIPSGEWDAQTSLWFWGTMGSPHLGQTTRPSESQQKNRTNQRVEISISIKHWVKLKEIETRYK